MKAISVIGLGNVFLGDDGFGPLVVESFRCAYSCLPQVEILDLGTPGLDLAPYLYDRQLAIVVDTVHSDTEIGTLSMFREEDFLTHKAKLRITGHDPGLWDSLAHLRLAGHAPVELIVLGIHPESCDFAERISPRIASAAPRAAKTIAQTLVDRGVECFAREPVSPPNLWWLNMGNVEQAAAA